MLIYVLICVVFGSNLVHSLEIGDVCLVQNKSGTCQSLSTCLYARRLVSGSYGVKPTLCYYEGKEPIVCCPKGDFLFGTGEARQYFEATDDGVKRSRDLTCRYDGTLPMVCCNNTEVPTVPEPEECPKLRRPSVPVNHIAWNKCLDYQRYLHKCVANKNNEYFRVNTCGIPKNRYGFRISEGDPAELKEFPHMAVLGCHNSGVERDADIVWIGGGSLISDRFILTAAHVLQSPESRLGPIRYALLGALNKTDIRSGLIYNIIRKIPHDFYQSKNKQYDIALVELERRVTLSEFIRPACLPVPGLETSPHITVAGWGQINSVTKETSTILLTANVSLTNNELCAFKLGGPSFRWDSDTMLCLVGTPKAANRFTDSCQGDSGGPAMSLIKDDILPCTYVVKGVVSFGPNCGNGAEATYTKVAGFLDWIVKNVWPKEYVKQQG